MLKPQDDAEPAGRQQRQETFAENIERVSTFQEDYDASPRGHNPAALSPAKGDASAAATEFQAILPTLVKIGYLLNLIHQRSTVLLPENWQN